MAREDPLVSGAAVLRERGPVRAPPVDFSRRHELGVARDRADTAGCDAITITSLLRRRRRLAEPRRVDRDVQLYVGELDAFKAVEPGDLDLERHLDPGDVPVIRVVDLR